MGMWLGWTAILRWTMCSTIRYTGMDNIRTHFTIAVAAAGCFLTVCWSAFLSHGECFWIESTTFFWLAIYTVKKHQDSLTVASIAMALCLGRIVPELPVRVFEFSSSVGSIPVTLSCIVAIILGCFCTKRNFQTLPVVISLIALFAVNTFNIHF